VLVIGLDCAEPSLVFDRWREELPHLRQLMDNGTYGPMESSIPCITVPAWASMMSGKDAGQLGLYGFHNRANYGYGRLSIANSTSITTPQVCDLASQAGKQVITIGVPPSYPPRPVNGVMVGCFLTPSTTNASRPYTYPGELAEEIRSQVGEYQVDVPNFRTNDKDYLLKQIYDMSDQHFKLIRHLMRSRPWDFCMFVEIGVDRIHHGMWKYHDPTHPKHEPGNRYQDAIKDYYRYLDGQIGDLLELVDDNTTLWVVSDHGAKKMDGGFCFNEWLIQEGYLALKTRPQGVAPLEKCEVDWARTKAWGGGGYYGRLFLNVRGREPEGLIAPGDYETVRDELVCRLEALPDPLGQPLGTRVFKPQEIYRECRGVPPDLIVYFGDLAWRSVGSIGLDGIYTFENDTGPDDANHAQFGMFIHYDPSRAGQGRVPAIRLMDVAPSLLTNLELPVPTAMQGRAPGFARTGRA
jgi:predicted AlkP superfamily phosphohydrolase/phosphomutase